MSKLTKLTMALFIASFFAAAPAIGADTSAVTQGAAQMEKGAQQVQTGAAKAQEAMTSKPDLGAAMKEKAAKYVEQGQQKVDKAAQDIQKRLGGMKHNATQPKSEIVDVQQESVTVTTPDGGVAKETTTTIIPEGQAPAKMAPAK